MTHKIKSISFDQFKLKPICGCKPVCVYSSSKLIVENKEEEEQASQFLMGLHDSFPV